MYYVLVARHGGLWADFVVISQSDLREAHVVNAVGTVASGKVVLRLILTGTECTCGKSRLAGKNQKPADFSRYRSDFSRWPSIKH